MDAALENGVEYNYQRVKQLAPQESLNGSQVRQIRNANQNRGR